MTGADIKSLIAPLAARHGLDAEQACALTGLAEQLHVDPLAPTSIRAAADIVDLHIADSLAALEVEEVADARKVADIGAGAGLPGLALAVALPAGFVTEIDSQSRKCAFIDDLIERLQLANAVAVCVRVEQWQAGRGAHDLVLARAVGPQPVVLEYAAPLLETGGLLVDWRGQRVSGEEQAAGAAAEELGLRRREIRRIHPSPAVLEHHLHVFEKVAPTPDRFPRRVGVARKRPLGAAPTRR